MKIYPGLRLILARMICASLQLGIAARMAAETAATAVGTAD